MKVGAAAAKLAPAKPGLIEARLWVPVWAVLFTVGNRADSLGVEVATSLTKLAMPSLVEFATDDCCISHFGHSI